MRETQLLIVGAGGFGRNALDVYEAARDAGSNLPPLAGVLDDRPSPANLDRLKRRKIPYVGPVSTARGGDFYVIAINNPVVREELSRQLNRRNLSPYTLIHPSATVASSADIGAGAVICAGVRIASDVLLGSHVHVNFNATIGHDVSVEDYVSINPLASISGECVVGGSTILGAGSVVRNGVTIGQHVTVGASACVLRDVPDGMIAKGVPAQW